jgi:hypothetical protein
VEAHPGKAILAGDHVFVERLVHVPEQHQPDLRGTVMTHLGELADQVYQGGGPAWNWWKRIWWTRIPFYLPVV